VRPICLLLVIAMQLFVSTALARPAGASPCTIEDSKHAFDALTSWDAVLNFYKKYFACDDGGIAEGVSDAVTKLLQNNWARFLAIKPHG
jgi:hypothetical protein